MARMREDLTFINDRDVVGSGLATSPVGVAWVRDIQQSVYVDAPADTAEAQAKAEQADSKAGNAQTTADAAQSAADSAQDTASEAKSSATAAKASADSAQLRADAAYALADGKVAKNVGPSFAAPAGAPSRVALPAYPNGTASATYTQADVQALMDQVAALTSRVAALIIDGRDNKSLTN